MALLHTRVPPLLLTLLLLLALWLLSWVTPEFQVYHPVRFLVAGLMLAVGSYFCIAGVLGFRRANTSVDPRNPEAASNLVTGGVYQISRHPMYLGFACLLVAWGVYLSSPWLLLVLPLFVLWIYYFQIRPEEKTLENKFGQAFLDYKAKVPCWL
ncbi:methyltransferase family protein [Marinospirillum sp.]|uniref:methyltransferase family protein n=1 Tax=Marinospirillum sp. TaxID=2183934 RepID=UPI00384C38EB